MIDPIPVYEVGLANQSPELKLDEPNEGTQLERSIYVRVGDIYRERTVLSRKVGSNRRELTDILGHNLETTSMCLIESKATAALQETRDKPTTRKVSNVEKHITRGLKQLCGAIDSVRGGEQIFDDGGEEIWLSSDRRTYSIHAIVLVSEMYFAVDWSAVARELVEISNRDRYSALFHVLDLQELSYLIAHSGNPERFSNALDQHWFHMKKKGTAYVRAKFLTSGYRELI